MLKDEGEARALSQGDYRYLKIVNTNNNHFQIRPLLCYVFCLIYLH